MSDSNMKAGRRKALKSIVGLGACLPCAAVFAGTDPKETHQPVEGFHQRVKTLVQNSGADVVRTVDFTITPGDLPWSLQLGEVSAGQSVTFLLSGRWWILKEHNYWVDPGVAFYARISGGTLYNPASNTGTMLADRTGQDLAK